MPACSCQHWVSMLLFFSRGFHDLLAAERQPRRCILVTIAKKEEGSPKVGYPVDVCRRSVGARQGGTEGLGEVIAVACQYVIVVWLPPGVLSELL